MPEIFYLHSFYRNACLVKNKRLQQVALDELSEISDKIAFHPGGSKPQTKPTKPSSNAIYLLDFKRRD